MIIYIRSILTHLYPEHPYTDRLINATFYADQFMFYKACTVYLFELSW